MGVCHFYLCLSLDCCWIDANAGGTGAAHSCHRLSNTAIYDNFAAWDAPFAGRKSDNALVVELAQWRELRFFPYASDA